MDNNLPREGDFVELRGRKWLVEGRHALNWGLDTLRLACVDDDAQGETLEVAWHAEIGARRLEDDTWSSLGRNGTDDPAVFSAYLRTLEWNTATAADRDLFQAPFRAGIRLDAYQLLPLRKALRLPRVNLLIGDDTGLGKTIEAGLILRELLLRRRIDFTVVTAPAGMTNQWKDELEAKFGLAFTIIDREQVGDVRRTRGFSANPWAVGSRFIVSHNLMAEEAYVAGLRDLLSDFRPRSLLILDEAHHAAPASSQRYAIDSQFTRSIRGLAHRFEHRLFLTATPHNGHSNSFSALLEMLDPQRFTRGVPVRPADLDPVMVRRLKSDLRLLGEPFPERIIEPIPLSGLPDDAPELVLARKLREYGDLRDSRLSHLPNREAGMAKLVFSGLQQRLLSSIAAFASTLRVHRKSLANPSRAVAEAARRFAAGAAEPDETEPADEQSAQTIQEQEEGAATEAATSFGVRGTPPDQLRAELDLVDEMLRIAEQHQNRPDARVAWIADWVRKNMTANGKWNSRRLILFTEWEVTRRWLERRLKEAVDDLDPEPRIGVFTGLTTTDRREAIKRAFNADPAEEPLRILICTDAAREGINLQAHCHDLIHIDLPWNPARLEQRNGRIDRKLQPSPKVWCRYFVFAQREEDIVLGALVRKTDRIRGELGSIGQVIADRLQREGIRRASELAADVEAEDGGGRSKLARAEMDDADERRRLRLKRDIDDLRDALERSRQRVGVDSSELQGVVGVALQRAGTALDAARAGAVNGTPVFRLDPSDAAFRDPGWSDVFDDLRERPRRRGERPAEWRANSAIRQIAFRPPILPDQTDATGVVQLHLEHRLVRRLLSRCQSALNIDPLSASKIDPRGGLCR